MNVSLKIKVLVNLLYVYVGIYASLFLVGISTISFDSDALRTLINPIIHILVISCIAFFLPRKKGSLMYWVSVVLILLELVRKLSGAGILIWLKRAGLGSEATDPTFFMFTLALLYSGIFLVASVIILQKDVRVYLRGKGVRNL
ncbi:hypothetical protein A2763_01655 [Candidatus Kaiserbacteria bacterium RIFCSPHIGHO2_01_FULL_54_36]|uniref:Uncharacterized protein n=1 Tax=Candidatus Kaiserbacteria bacterium RIFCSPHIGHO2_01_FULL_54_36 TaxID=1798482 RepID=A0A1F6CN45_9BACT|nr:MAG: hypothetical protein A2763_01655 [Candidatus Kaiserbacteria bacterium RIFCSPHIGHO2_01_FULL_54_36]OGG75825.1 MAG: hypothetical protein A3A41_02690 [Candidatus Kaiserbacteria bacterium RIFCSPLOWO2_01_FULL_54_22]